MLFHRHQFLYGISGIVLWWFDSYLTGRTQTVTVSGLSSRPADISFSVQQGSVLGPIFFILYSAPLSSLIETHSVSNQSFADNIQLLRCCPPDQIHATLLTCLTQYKLRLMNLERLQGTCHHEETVTFFRTETKSFTSQQALKKQEIIHATTGTDETGEVT